MNKQLTTLHSYLLCVLLTTSLSSIPIRNQAQAPVISYSSVSNSYPVGASITTLTPSNTGGAITGTYGAVTTLAGDGTAGLTDGTGTGARFGWPAGITADAMGNLFVTELGNDAIRKITPAGVVTTVAGNGTRGAMDGIGSAATFNGPTGITVDGTGNLYVTDTYNAKIRKITPTGIVTTFASSVTGTNELFDLTIDPSGNLYVLDNRLILKISPMGVVITSNPYFGGYRSITMGALGDLYVANSERIDKINPLGERTTIAGNGTRGSTDGISTIANFNVIQGITRDNLGNIYVAAGNKIRKISSTGIVTTLAGSGTPGFADGIGALAQFRSPWGVTTDAFGNLYVADAGNSKIRKISLTGYSIYPALPTGLSMDGATGVISGTPTQATVATTYTITATNVSGSHNTTIRFATNGAPPVIAYSGLARAYPIHTPITLSPNNTGGAVIGTHVVATWIAGSETRSSAAGSVDGIGSNASFYEFRGMVTDAFGNLYVTGNHKIRKVTIDGVVTTFAGSGIYGTLDGIGTAAGFNNATGIAVDASNNLYVTEPNVGSHKIRKITPDGVVTTLAGSGVLGLVNGIGTMAQFDRPTGIVVDGSGNVYVADYGNNQIRKITPTGIVTTFAGSSTGIAGAADGIGTAASFNQPAGLTIDAVGNLYVGDYGNTKIRKISPSGTVTTLVGTNDGFFGLMDGTSTTAAFYRLSNITSDAAGNVYVPNEIVRKVTPTGMVTTLSNIGLNGVTNIDCTRCNRKSLDRSCW